MKQKFFKKGGNFKMNGQKFKRFKWKQKTSNSTSTNFNLHHQNNDIDDESINQNTENINEFEIPTTKTNGKKILKKKLLTNTKSTLNTSTKKDDCPDNANEIDKSKKNDVDCTNNAENKNNNLKKSIIKKKQRTQKEHHHSDSNHENETIEPKTNKKITKTRAKKELIDEEKSLETLKDENFVVSDDDSPKKLKSKSKKSNPKIDESEIIQELFGDAQLESPDYEDIHVFKLNEGGSLPSIKEGLLEKILERYFKHKQFKHLQKDAILRICSGLSTLCVMSTGYGKSLIYQFCTKLYSLKYPKNCLTVIISPLISLMQDQILNLSKHLNGVYYDVSMSYEDYQELCTNVKDGSINLLFTSPESLVANRNLKDLLKNSYIPFICIDEIHCLSEWSHNFRPSYLQICDFIRKELNVKCILGLTATATIKTIEEIKLQTNISSENIIKNNKLPDNLLLSISCDKNKEKGLIDFLKQSNAVESNTIIYCTRRDQTERLATMLRMNFTGQIAEAYHAGLTPAQRKRIQKAFLTGKLKIIVATVAFGMGINMSNVKTIIHYNMPICIENYTQEIGRAGRAKGDQARCHLFLDKNNVNELNDIKKFIYSNDYDQSTIKKFLNKIFIPCKATNLQCKHDNLVPIDELVSYLNLSLESIQTLICYLNNECGIKLISSTCFSEIQVTSYDDRVFNCPKHEVIQILKDLTMTTNHVKISDILSRLKQKINYFELVRVLKTFEYESRKNVKISFQNSSLYLTHDCLKNENFSDNLDRLFDILLEKVLIQNSFCKKNFLLLFKLLNENSFKTVNNMFDQREDVVFDKSECLKIQFNDYFSNTLNLDNLNFKDLNDYYVTSSNSQTDGFIDLERLRSMINNFVAVYGGNDLKLNGRLIANIFHGIQTPNYPANIWSSNKNFWRAGLDFDYELVLKTANELFIR